MSTGNVTCPFCTGYHSTVLIFLETAGRRFSIVGGKAIHDRTPDRFWQDQVDRMKADFLRDRFADGLTGFVAEIGNLLQQHFPRKADDTNEFPDQISFG